MLLLQAATRDQQAGEAINRNPNAQGTTHLPEALQKVPKSFLLFYFYRFSTMTASATHVPCANRSSYECCVTFWHKRLQYLRVGNWSMQNLSLPPDPDLETSNADPHLMQLHARHMACNSQQGGVPRRQLPYLWRQADSTPVHGSLRPAWLYKACWSFSTTILEKRLQSRPTRYDPLA